MIDIKIARGLIERLENDPASHNQDTWARVTDCGTEMCAAGHICAMVGAEFDWKPNGSTAYVFLDSIPQYYTEPAHGRPRAERGYIPMVAQRIMGIDSATRERLFFDARTLDDVKAILLPLIAAAEREDRELDFTGDEGTDDGE